MIDLQCACGSKINGIPRLHPETRIKMCEKCFQDIKKKMSVKNTIKNDENVFWTKITKDFEVTLKMLASTVRNELDNNNIFEVMKRNITDIRSWKNNDLKSTVKFYSTSDDRRRYCIFYIN